MSTCCLLFTLGLWFYFEAAWVGQQPLGVSLRDQTLMRYRALWYGKTSTARHDMWFYAHPFGAVLLLRIAVCWDITRIVNETTCLMYKGLQWHDFLMLSYWPPSTPDLRKPRICCFRKRSHVLFCYFLALFPSLPFFLQCQCCHMPQPLFDCLHSSNLLLTCWFPIWYPLEAPFDQSNIHKVVSFRQ